MDRPSWVRNEAEWKGHCCEIVEASEALIAGHRSLTECARRLAGLSHKVCADRDPDFLTFIGVNSETDRFPIGHVRAEWEPTSLARVDGERSEIESRLLAPAIAAARNLVLKYGSA